MSCGQGHGDDDLHFHDPAEREPEGEPAPELDAPAEEEKPVKEPSQLAITVKAGWAKHGYAIKPYAWYAGVDGVVYKAHEVVLNAGLNWPVHGYGTLDTILLSAAAGIIADGVEEIRMHRGKRSEEYRNRVRRMIIAATGWSMLGTAVTPVGWHGIVQYLALGGFGWLASNHVYEIRRAKKLTKAPEPNNELPRVEEPLALEAPPPPPENLVRFRTRFFSPGGELKGVTADNYRELRTGFLMYLHFPEEGSIGQSNVRNVAVQIGKLYKVPASAVSVGYVPGNKSEADCQLVVTTLQETPAEEKRNPTHNRWNGKSTWNPVTGCVDLGVFVDDAVTHYEFNKPRSGARAGYVAGVPGSGKTGTINVITAEAGQAMLCSRCGARGDCGQCDPQRVMATWVGDNQAQGLGIWKGRADLTGWGVLGCAGLIQLADGAARARIKQNETLKWYDKDPITGQERENIGKGWFDPAVGFPLILLILDELPYLVNHADQDMAEYILGILVEGIMGWRKVGIHPLLGMQMLDVSQIGKREIREMIKFLNAIAHRCDQVSSYMGDIKGDPTKLPSDMPGAGYIGNIDNRRGEGDRFTTKFCPENVDEGMTGVDIRHLAGKIQATPIRYDPAVQSVLDAMTIHHQQVIEDWWGPQTAKSAGADDTVTLAAVQDIIDTAGTAAEGPGFSGVAYREDCENALAAIRLEPGADMFRLMERTGLGMGALGRALDALAQNGEITNPSDGTYAAA